MTLLSESVVTPEGVTATLEPSEYEALIRRLEGVELARARANTLVAEAIQARDVLYLELATKYALPQKPAQIQWNDTTRTVAVKGS
jgi:hypothetical protein